MNCRSILVLAAALSLIIGAIAMIVTASPDPVAKRAVEVRYLHIGKH